MKYFLIFTLLLLTGCQRNLVKQEVCFQDHCFNVEVAETKKQQTQGLMNKEALEENEGMLFEYAEEGEHNIWMKNMRFPIDIIWLDENKKVIYLQENAQPCSESFCQIYKANKLSKYVIELPAGTADKINLQIGDSVN
jgi:uncharacterized membrane protein (UPF0127 family)